MNVNFLFRAVRRPSVTGVVAWYRPDVGDVTGARRSCNAGLTARFGNGNTRWRLSAHDPGIAERRRGARRAHWYQRQRAAGRRLARCRRLGPRLAGPLPAPRDAPELRLRA